MPSFSPPLELSELAAVFADRFLLLSKLDEGGQGSVFLANPADPADQTAKQVALKIYFPGHSEHRTKREIEALMSLSQANMVRLHAAGRISLRGKPCFFVATDYVDGPTLEKVLASRKLPEREAALLGRDIALAIASLWDRRIVHRDIKPANILQNSANRFVLIDLGVARHLSRSDLTSLGKTWGTHGYMSPEQARARRQLTSKSDIFALGVVLQQAILGHHPTWGDQERLLQGCPVDSAVRRSVGKDLADLLAATGQLLPYHRPGPREVVRKLSNLLGREVVT